MCHHAWQRRKIIVQLQTAHRRAWTSHDHMHIYIIIYTCNFRILTRAHVYMYMFAFDNSVSSVKITSLYWSWSLTWLLICSICTCMHIPIRASVHMHRRLRTRTYIHVRAHCGHAEMWPPTFDYHFIVDVPILGGFHRAGAIDLVIKILRTSQASIHQKRNHLYYIINYRPIPFPNLMCHRYHDHMRAYVTTPRRHCTNRTHHA